MAWHFIAFMDVTKRKIAHKHKGYFQPLNILLDKRRRSVTQLAHYVNNLSPKSQSVPLMTAPLKVGAPLPSAVITQHRYPLTLNLSSLILRYKSPRRW